MAACANPVVNFIRFLICAGRYAPAPNQHFNEPHGEVRSMGQMQPCCAWPLERRCAICARYAPGHLTERSSDAAWACTQWVQSGCPFINFLIFWYAPRYAPHIYMLFASLYQCGMRLDMRRIYIWRKRNFVR